MGCPTSYDGRTATWSKGRLSRLSSGSLQQGMENFTYSYNAYGQRVSKSYSHMEGSSGANPIPNGELIAYSKQFYYDHAGRLLAETASKTLKGQSATSENIVFLYDESTIIGMEHTVGGTTSSYYFHRSPMGDVVGIYNTSGTLVAKYLYDAWGNCTIASGTTNYTVANANPIRYRGYYYDDDTGLYYLNARYYSPKWRRFISPDDTTYLDPETVNGLNLYCYCGNDPINSTRTSVDNLNMYRYCSNNSINCTYPGEHAPVSAIAAPVLYQVSFDGLLAQAVTSIVSYVGMAIASIWDESVRNDMNAIGWNPFNRSESAVINSNKVSFYKGAPVFRTSISRSGSFCGIFLSYNSSVTDLRHEYGHNMQQMLLGPVKFGLMIGLPSWLEWSTRSYYDRPWEISADMLGGAARPHSQVDINRGYWYLAISSLFGPLGYLFLFGEY